MAGIAQRLDAGPSAAVPQRLNGVWSGSAEVEAGGCRWHLPPGLHTLLLGPQGLRLPEWLEQGAATIVKKGPHRVVYRVQLGTLTFFVKHNLAPDWRAWLRQWIRPSKARMEFDRARGIAERGIDTVIPLGFGEPLTRFGNGESFLLTLALENTQPLQQFLATTLVAIGGLRHARLRQDLARQLGNWVARLHDAGICHNDFHAGNILVRLGVNDQIELFLVDLNAVHLGKPMKWRASLKNLVMLNRWFALRASRGDRLRFWRAYYKARFTRITPPGPACPQNPRILALDLERRTLRSNLYFWHRRDARCQENNRYYRKVKGPGTVGHAVADLDRADLKQLMADPDAPFLNPGDKLLKDARSSTVIELELRVAGEVRKVIYKRFRVTRWHDPMRSVVRATEAMRSWVHGQGLCERGLPTPRPLAVFHRRRWGMYHEGYLITEKIDNAQTLMQFLKQVEDLPPLARLRRVRLQIAQAARIVREMHRRRLGHRDLKANNVLVSKDPRALSYPGHASNLGLLPNLPSSIWIIDLVGVERHRYVCWSRKVQNLTRMNASFFGSPSLTRTDRLRFLREYMQWNLHGNDHWKKWWRAIQKGTLAKIARNQRRGRPLS